MGFLTKLPHVSRPEFDLRIERERKEREAKELARLIEEDQRYSRIDYGTSTQVQKPEEAKDVNPTHLEVRNGKPCVTSLQVADAFSREHRNVLRDIRDITETDEDDFALLNFEQCSYTNENNREMPMYAMTKDGFILLVMGYTGADAMKVKKAYIAEFNRMEAKLAGPVMPNFTNPIEAARAWADEREKAENEKIRAEASEAALKEAQPKIEFANALEGSTDTVSMSIMSRILNHNGFEIGLNRLYAILRDLGLLCKAYGERRNTPTQKGVDKGWFEIQERIICDGKISITTRVTGRGQNEILKMFQEKQIGIRSSKRR